MQAMTQKLDTQIDVHDKPYAFGFQRFLKYPQMGVFTAFLQAVRVDANRNSNSKSLSIFI